MASQHVGIKAGVVSPRCDRPNAFWDQSDQKELKTGFSPLCVEKWKWWNCDAMVYNAYLFVFEVKVDCIEGNSMMIIYNNYIEVPQLYMAK